MPKGAASARLAAVQLQDIALPPEDWRIHLAARRIGEVKDPVIDFIRIVNDTELSGAIIASRLSLKPGDILEAQVMSEDLTKIYGLELFEEVTYSVVSEGGQISVEVRVRPPDNGESNLRFGLALQDDFEGEYSFQLAAGYIDPALNSWGGEWRLLVNVGDTLGLSSEFYQPIDAADCFFVYANVAGRKINANIVDRSGLFLNQVRVTEGGVQSGIGVNFGQWGSAHIGLDRVYGGVKGRVGFPIDVSTSFDDTIVAASFSIDTLDSVLFPLNGVNLDIEYENKVSWLNGDGRVDALTFGAYVPTTWGRNTVGLISQFGATFNGTPIETDLFPLGGFLNLSAYTPGQLTGNNGGSVGALY